MTHQSVFGAAKNFAGTARGRTCPRPPPRSTATPDARALAPPLSCAKISIIGARTLAPPFDRGRAFPSTGVLTLNLFGNRFCENVERAHKSNNVMFIVDFRESAYYQRCHDPDCRGTRDLGAHLSEDVLDESHTLIEMLYEPPTLDDDDEEDVARVPTFDEMDEEDVRAVAAAAL